MKQLTLILASLCGIAGGLLGSRFAFPPEPERNLEALQPAEAVEGPRLAAPDDPLRRDLDELRRRIELLEGGASRTSLEPGPEPVAGAPEPERVLPTDDERARILTVLDQERERARREAELRRAQRMEDEIHRRARNIADGLGLATGSEQKIASVFLQELDKIEAVREAYRAGARGPESRKAFRENLKDVRSWRAAELETAFGPEVAGRISRAVDRGLEKQLGDALPGGKKGDGAKNEGRRDRRRDGEE